MCREWSHGHGLACSVAAILTHHATLQIHRITARSMMVAFTAPPTHHRTADISVATAVVLMVVEAIIDLCFIRLTQRWSQQSLQMATMLLEFMNGLSYTTIIELAEPLAGRRGSVLSR